MASFADDPFENVYEFEPIRLMLLIILTDPTSHRGLPEDFPLFSVIEHISPHSMAAERWESCDRRYYG